MLGQGSAMANIDGKGRGSCEAEGLACAFSRVGAVFMGDPLGNAEGGMGLPLSTGMWQLSAAALGHCLLSGPNNLSFPAAGTCGAGTPGLAQRSCRDGERSSWHSTAARGQFLTAAYAGGVQDFVTSLLLHGRGAAKLQLLESCDLFKLQFNLKTSSLRCCRKA